MRQYPEAYMQFLVHFHGTRDYFECHEMMEAHWKRETAPALRSAWLCLIQTAVAAYHERRNNKAGADKMWNNALRNANPAVLAELGLDGDAFVRLLSLRRQACASGGAAAYEDPDLPLADAELIECCERMCAQMGVKWRSRESDATAEIVHKHKLRDRSDVVRERELSWQIKRSSRTRETT